MIDENSLFAYHTIKDSLSARQKLILDCLETSPMSAKELVKKTGLAINQITPRVKELREKNMVVSYWTNYDNGRPVNVWGVKKN